MIRDTLMRGVVAGAVATVVQGVLNWSWPLLGLPGVPLTVSLARVVFVIPPAQAPLAGEIAIAGTAQILIGGVYGIILALILRASGNDLGLLKGLGAGLLLGFVHLAVLPFLARTPERVSILMSLTHLADHALFGLVTGWVILALSEPVRT